MSVTPTNAGDRQLRVVMVANSVRRGGAETQLVRIALGLAERGHEVRVLTFLDRDGWQTELADAGIELVHLPTRSAGSGVRTVARAVALCRELNPHAIVGFDYQPSIAVRLIGRLADVPVVVSSVRNEELGGGPLREASVRLTDPMASLTTTNSRRVAASLLERRLVSPARLQVIPNGMDTSVVIRPEETRAGMRSELAVADGTFLWLSVSYLRREKDVGTLLRAVATTVEAGRPSRLVVVGDGPLEGELSVLSDDLGLDRHVTFLGRRTDVPDLLAAADGFVLSSRAEGLPNAVMEAMAAGLPIVATSVGGVPELLDPGTGVLVPPADPRALAQAMQRLEDLADEERTAMGARARREVESTYGLAALIDGWEDLLRTELGRAERRAARSREPADAARAGGSA